MNKRSNLVQNIKKYIIHDLIQKQTGPNDFLCTENQVKDDMLHGFHVTHETHLFKAQHVQGVAF